MQAPAALAAEIEAAIRALPAPATAAVRDVRRRFSRVLKARSAEFVIALAWSLIREHDRRWVAYELIRFHPAAMRQAGPQLETMAVGLDSWDVVDAFGRILAGPAWLRGIVGDDLIERWAASPDRWARRLALVCTVALNAKTDGGTGDTPRTLAICARLAGDRDDMVVKAMSWALRELALRESSAVEAFMQAQADVLAPRIRREVKHKLVTGLKAPRRRA